jgi:hypothetical protein
MVRVVAWMLLDGNAVYVRPGTPRALETLIRIAQDGAGFPHIGEEFALAPDLCMTLIAVEQRKSACVKIALNSRLPSSQHR